MSLVLLNLQSNQKIKLDDQYPLIIGRGNVDGCHDKRVSRNHGRITCTLDGKIRLVALHCNPCFFTRNGVPPVLQLNKDEEETLSEGDCLGLLPNAFWFQVTSNKETNTKKDCNSTNVNVIKEEETVDNKLVENSIENGTPIPENVNCIASIQEESSNSLPKPSIDAGIEEDAKSASTSYGFGCPEFEKTKRLPLWMYEIDESIELNKNTKKHTLVNEEETENKKQKITTANVIAQEIKKETNVNSKDDTKAKEEEIEIINEPSTSKVESVDESNSIPFNQVSSNSSIQTQGESSKALNHKEGYESDVNEEIGSLSKRPMCQYEDSCYRKNPQHKLDFSHPGDADYIPYEQRPVCQYGAACYRKNTKHKVEFRHPPPGTSSRDTSPPTSCTSLASSLPAKRRRKKVKKQNSDYEDSDEYDLEDPFINDASSDDFVPSGLDSEEEDLDDFDASQDD